jgi:hypothetical protein
MDSPLTLDATLAEEVYCEARARHYVGAERIRPICDRELELWIKAERAVAREELQARLAAIRALLRHLQGSLEQVIGKLEKVAAERPQLALHAADVPELVSKAQLVLALWREYASQEMYGEMLRDGMDRCDFDVLEEAMTSLRGSLRPFEAPT